jgi:hypothetical protein
MRTLARLEGIGNLRKVWDSNPNKLKAIIA